ncbi:MAG: hypothetical protein RL693_2729 [Verrucomicrobiota bacterium]|jgi:Fe-S-cluster containining protein
MCCNGVMFHTVILQPGDSAPALKALGLKVKERKEKRYIEQPCPAHQKCQCTIYASRPTRCRLFECRQLKQVAVGEITEAMAREKIQEAQRLVQHLEALLEKAGGANPTRPLSKRCEAVMVVPLDASSDEVTVTFRQELAASFAELDTLLDQDFRVEPPRRGGVEDHSY